MMPWCVSEAEEEERGMLLTTRMERRAWRGVVRVMRPRIVAPTVGRMGVCRGCVVEDVEEEGLRRMDREGGASCFVFEEGGCGGVEDVRPTREAQIWLLWRCVPVLGVYSVLLPSDWPGRATVEVMIAER